jgi:glycosyltransferase involved in cell wall biosynthesis
MLFSPKLAVIITCYNYEAFVGRAIRSVLDQASNDYELVVIDDGSTDGSWDVITDSGATAFKIDNRGQRAACLFGLERTKAPFVLFLDADDELKPDALSTIIGHLDPDVAKLQFPLTRVDANSNVISGAFPPLEDFRSSGVLAGHVLKCGAYRTPPTSGNVFRRDVCEFLREATYDKAVDGVILFVAPFLGDIVSLSEELGCYRIHGSNQSGLGRLPDIEFFERDISRFRERMQHLRAILRRIEQDKKLVDSCKTFYWLERKFSLDIASGRRPRLAALLSLILKLRDEPASIRTKAAMAAFYGLALLLASDRRKALLKFRYTTGPRTTADFIKQMIA